MTTLRFVEKLRDLVGSVEVVLSDIWGVVHNGLEAFPEACEALHTFRKQGGTVILITNAPRPADSVQRQLRKLSVADDIYDAIVSSGDLTRHFVADHPGRKMFWIGPERDSSIHRGLDPVLAPLEEADYIVCTGLFDDETESAEDYRGMMLQAHERKLPLICANPDIVVERGDRLIYCAGAIAMRLSSTAFSPSGIPCAPTWRAPTASGSIACSLHAASTPRILRASTSS